MAATGNSFETPHACPFVALELDRDKRSDRPDYRHRCFAEPTPAPRSIAHQEAFCLSPNFAGCPIFQDWAVRAAARPTATGPAAPGAAADVMAAATLPPSATVEESVQPVVDAAPIASAPAAATELPPVEEWPEDVSVTAADVGIAAAAAAATGMGPGAVAPPTFATTGWQDEEAPESQQLGVFDAPPPADEPPSYDEPQSSYGEPDAGYPEPPVAPAFVPPPAQPSRSDRSTAESAAAAAAVPAFLAGRSSRPAAPTSYAADSAPPPRPTPPPAREEIVPSWEIDGRYGAEMPLDNGGGGGSRFDGILTAVAVVAILAIGVAAVLFLPGLLNKGSTTKSPAPASFVVPSGLPTIAPSLNASGPPTSVPTTTASTEPTASPSPAGSPRLYRIKPGDSLARIANKFDTTVDAILAANPEITDPNNILVGQIIVIPQAVPTAPPETATP